MLGAIIGAVAGIGSALLSSSASKKAAKSAATAQTQASQQNNALVRELYGQNKEAFTPYMQSGARANALIDSFIYGGQQAAPAQAAPPANQFLPATDPAMNHPAGYYDMNPSTGYGLQYNQHFAPQPSQQSIAPAGAVTAPAPAAPGNALSGYQQFVNSPYYQNPLQEGFRGLNHGLAANGRLESGDAMKRALRYGQDYAAGRQGEFLSLASQQANRGFGSASALAGVGQNMVTDTSANNRAAADALSNAALLRGQANQQLIGGIGNALGQLASSYKF